MFEKACCCDGWSRLVNRLISTEHHSKYNRRKIGRQDEPRLVVHGDLLNDYFANLLDNNSGNDEVKMSCIIIYAKKSDNT